jgi:hypothetical protein
MLVAPPILMQVPEPSTLTKPGPKAAQELPLAVPFNGSNFSDGAGLSGLWGLDCWAGAAEAGRARIIMARRKVRIPPFSACHRLTLPDEPDANSLAAAPDHFAPPPRPGVAR